MNDSDDLLADLFSLMRSIIDAHIPASDEEKIKQLVRDRWGGHEIYVKKRDSETRASQIRNEFNGRNRIELQQKYGISKGQFYRDLKGS